MVETAIVNRKADQTARGGPLGKRKKSGKLGKKSGKVSGARGEKVEATAKGLNDEDRRSQSASDPESEGSQNASWWRRRIGVLQTKFDKFTSKLQRKLDRARACLKDANQRARRAVAKAIQLERDLAKERAKLAAKTLKRSKAQRYFTARGGMGAALTRCMSGCAGATLGLALGVNMSRTALSRFEQQLRVSLHCRARAWRKARYAMLEMRPMDGVRIMVHCLRCDATNRGVWRKSKLHPTLLESTAVVLEPITSRHGLNEAAIEDMKTLADLQVLTKKAPGDRPGMKLYGMIAKQVGALGMGTEHLWDEERKCFAALEDGGARNGGPLEDSKGIQRLEEQAVAEAAAEFGWEKIRLGDGPGRRRRWGWKKIWYWTWSTWRERGLQPRRQRRGGWELRARRVPVAPRQSQSQSLRT